VAVETSPDSYAKTTICTRSRKLSFISRRAMCVLTVVSAMNRWAAIFGVGHRARYGPEDIHLTMGQCGQLGCGRGHHRPAAGEPLDEAAGDGRRQQ
jgi:hypothetical protein